MDYGRPRDIGKPDGHFSNDAIRIPDPWISV